MTNRGNSQMIIKNLNRIITAISFCSALVIINSHLLFAQAGVQGTQQHVLKWMWVGGLRSWFSNSGSEGEYFRRDRTTYVGQDQIDGMLYPGEYNNRMKGVKISKAFWLGTTNFLDPVTNTLYPHKVVSAGPAGVYMGTEIIADESLGNVGIKTIGKFDHPNVYVDNTSSSVIEFNDEVDEVDDALPSDRMIVNKFHTSIGITVTRKIIAYSQQYNDNYYIYEYTLKNTGIIDRSGEQKLNKTLTGVVFYLLGRYSFAGESYSGTGRGDWFPAASSWGRNTLIDHVGQDENHQLPAPNDFQAMFAYYGPHSSTQFGSPLSDIGLPGPRASNVWTLAGTQFSGIAILHADKGPGDTTHDKSKLISTISVGADATRDITNSPGYQYNQAIMTQKYLEYMTAGHPNQTQAEQVGKDPITGWPNAYANTFGTDPGGFIATQGLGPYDLAPGDSVRIVVADAVAGISRNKILEIAENWFTNNTSEFVLPNGTTTTDRDVYKNTWVFSGKDSLFQTFRRAIAAYNNNYKIQQPPPPPDNFEVNSGGDRIRLSWSNNAGSWPNFDGYRVYRAEGLNDTVFTKIFECDRNNVVNSYDDKNAIRGFNYYYYVQSKDDGSTNDIQPGVPLVSSKYYTMTSNPAFLTRPAGAALTFTTKKSYSQKQALVVTNPTTQMPDTSYYFLLPISVADPSGTVVRSLKVNVNGVRQLPSTYNVSYDTLTFIKVPDIDSIEVEIISPISPLIDLVFAGDDNTDSFVLTESLEDINGNKLYDVEVKVYEVRSVGDTVEVLPTPQYEILKFSYAPDSLKFTEAPSDSNYITVSFKAVQRTRDYNLSQIRIVPNPYNLKARNIQFGETDLTTLDRLAFYNLPPVCKIKIYTETGDLIETIDHTNGSGDDYWHSLTSSGQIVVSGLYIAYFEVTEDYRDDATGELLYRKGDSIFKKFVIIR